MYQKGSGRSLSEGKFLGNINPTPPVAEHGTVCGTRSIIISNLQKQRQGALVEAAPNGSNKASRINQTISFNPYQAFIKTFSAVDWSHNKMAHQTEINSYPTPVYSL
jgi:hypothetical protein